MEHFTSLINSYLPEPHAALLNGILFGVKLTYVTSHFYESLKKVGLIHIVVLSGMNITLLSAVILNTLVTIIGRKYAMMLTIAVIILFIFFVGLEPPIVRAATMGILSLIGLLFGRKTLALYTLFFTSVILIIIFPDWLTSISFQLSFAATLGIILFGKIGGSLRHPEGVKRLKDPEISKHGFFPIRFAQGQNDNLFILQSYILEELRISLSAQIFTAPLIFFYFRQISFIAPISNIMVAWMIAPLMILGMITVAIGLVWWRLGFMLSWLSHGLLSILIFVVELFSEIPYSSINLN